MKSIDRILSWMLYAAVIGMVIFAIIANFLLITQSAFAPFRVVEGTSMQPTISEGDAVMLTHSGGEHLRVGDIVVFPDPEDPGTNIIHRVIRLEEDGGDVYAVTKGDANASSDPFAIPADRVEGKVGLVLPRVGLFISFLRTPYGFFLCVLAPFAILLVYFLAKWNQERRAGLDTLLTRNLFGSFRARTRA